MNKVHCQKLEIRARQTFLCSALTTINLVDSGSLVMMRRIRAHVYVISVGVNLYPCFVSTGAGGSGVVECSRARAEEEASMTAPEVCSGVA